MNLFVEAEIICFYKPSMRILFCLLLLLGHASVIPADEAMDALVGVLKENTDPQFDLDILRGLRDSLEGTGKTDTPKDWAAVELRLKKSPKAEVRELARLLSLKFGSASALVAYREQLVNPNAPIKLRLKAIRSLADAGDKHLVNLAMPFAAHADLGVTAIVSLGRFNDNRIAGHLLQIYPTLPSLEHRRATLSTLVSRMKSARALISAVSADRIPAKHLTADIVRRLRRFEQPDLTAAVAKIWGVVRDSPAAKKQEMAKYKKLLSTKSSSKINLAAGRELFNVICGQCHTMFGVGGKVGPDITGANRSDLDYILHNILDPNAEIPNDYRTTNIDTEDDRALTGIVTREDANTVTLATPTEVLTLAKKDIAYRKLSELSMMPEGLMQPLNNRQIRELVAYLQSPVQVLLAK